MNILLINHYAGSVRHGMEFRPYYLAREWIRMGHRVRIVAASFAHVRARQPSAELIDSCETIDGIEYQWLRTPSYSGNSAARAINIFAFAGKLLAGSKRLARDFRPDIVIASSTHPFDIYGAKRIASLSKARLVFEIHDLWPLSPIELGGMSPNHPFIFAIGAAEQRAVKSANVIISILPATKDYLIGRGMTPEKFFHVPNGIDVNEWETSIKPVPEDHRLVLGKLRSQAKFLICYAGAHGVANALDSLIEAARQTADLDVHYLLVGHGPEKPRLMAKAAALNLKNITFLDPIPKASIPDLLEKSDALYLSLQNQSLFRFGISPNKLIDYMMAGKPIIQAVAAGNDPVREAECGITIPPEHPEALLEAISHLKRLDDDARFHMGQRGHAYALAHHDYRVLAKQFLKAAVDTQPIDAETISNK